MVKSRIGRKIAVCLDCGHEWLAKDNGTIKPPRCTSQPCRSRNVVWKDSYTAEELQALKDDVRKEIIELGGQPVKAEEPKPEPMPKPVEAEPVEAQEPEAEVEQTEPPELVEPEPETVRTNEPEKPTKKPKAAPKRSASGKFTKNTEDKPDIQPPRTYSSDYPTYEEIKTNYKGISPLFIYILGGLALIGAFFFLRRKGGRTDKTPETKTVQKEAEPVPSAYFNPRIGGGLF